MTYYQPKSDWSDGVALVPLKVGDADLTFPTPDPAWVGELARFLRDGHWRASERPVGEVLQVLDAVNARWADSSSPERRDADTLLVAATGYPRAVIGPALDHLFAGLRSPHLQA